SALARGIGEAIGNAYNRRDGGHIQDNTATLLLHYRYHRMQNIIGTFDIDPDNPIEIIFRSMLQVADMCNTGIVNQDIDRTDGVDDIADILLRTYIAPMDRCLPARIVDGFSQFFRCCGIQFEDMHDCSLLSEPLANRPANTTPPSGNNCCLAS